MSGIDRRGFVKALGAATALGATSLPLLTRAASHGAKAKVIVIGGGFGGAIAAKYTKKYNPAVDVTLIEKGKKYYSCVFSNEVISGHSEMDSITFGYDGLAGHGINVVHDEVTGIDTEKKSVSTKGGKKMAYDYLVVSPGVNFKWDAIEGYDEAASEMMPHAWKAGPQTELLRKQIRAMDDGGIVAIAAPANPFRCPPGPYERAAQISHYLKHHKPKSKVIIFDAKDAFSKQALFMEGYEMHYPGMIEWRGKASDGKVNAVDPKTNTLITEFDEIEVAVANIIPPMTAAHIAHDAGLTDQSGWCPVDQKTFASEQAEDVFVIGDSCIAGKMPKSGYSANSQGKVAAAAITARLAGIEMPDPSYLNTCYSLITAEHGISVAAVYRLQDGSIAGVKDSGGVSPLKQSAAHRAREAEYARSWYTNIVTEMFG